MAVSAPSQVRSLAKAVATAFAAANLTEEQRNPPGIDVTDLPWACPALVSDLTLDGIPLNDYLDVAVSMDWRSSARATLADDVKPAVADRRDVLLASRQQRHAQPVLRQ